MIQTRVLQELTVIDGIGVIVIVLHSHPSMIISQGVLFFLYNYTPDIITTFDTNEDMKIIYVLKGT